MMKTLIWLVILGILAAGGYYGYEWYQGPEQRLQLVTASITRGDVVERIDATGRLEAVTTVQVGTQVSGTIKALYADFNSQVRAGQVVAELEPSLFETQVEQAQATVVRLQAEVERSRVQYEDAQVKLARSRGLAAKQLVPSTDRETAEANARAAEAALKAAEAQVVQSQASLNQSRVNLSHTIISAPIDGVVISRNVDVGQTVAASMSAPTLFEIANDLTDMRVNANIDEADIGMIAPGQTVTFQVDAYPDRTFTGTVSQVRLNPVIESNVVSYVTVIDVANEDLLLRPGMTANVTVEVARASDTLRVPASAIRFTPTPELFTALGQLVPDTMAEAESVTAAAGNGPAAPVQRTAVGGPPEGAAREEFGGRGGAGAGDPQREALRAQLEQMSPEERQAFFAARGGGRGGGRRGGNATRAGGGAAQAAGGNAAGQRGATSDREGRGQIWVVDDGQIEPVAVRTGISDGAIIAISGPLVQEGVIVATGAIQTAVPAAAPQTGNPLLPQFGRRGRGRGNRGNTGGGGGQQGGAGARGN